MAEKIILFGGSFDPVHLGHISVAQSALEKLNADKIILIPAKTSPLKKHSPHVSNEHRLAMLKIASSEYENLTVSDCEFHRPAPSYSFHTVEFFKNLFGVNAKLFWLAGADVVKDLPQWYRSNELLDMCQMCLMHRPGFPMPDMDILKGHLSDSQIDLLRKHILETPLLNVSSTEIRKRLYGGQDAQPLLDPQVYQYIVDRNLYSSDKV